MTLPVDELTRARTLLKLLYRHYSLNGISAGRSRESTLLELALDLLVWPTDPNEIDLIEKESWALVDETRDHLTDKSISRVDPELSLRYNIDRQVTYVDGHQTFQVEAETREEAEEKFRNDEGVFVQEELDVQGIELIEEFDFNSMYKGEIER